MNLNWKNWKTMPSPLKCRQIEGPENSGVYQIRNKITGQLIQFGIGIKCQTRMRSLYPQPYGTSGRNNQDKRNYILNNWEKLEYRTLSTNTKEDAKIIEDYLKFQNNHLFNT
jgi:hypothetical protein